MLFHTGKQQLAIAAVKDFPRSEQASAQPRGLQAHIAIKHQTQFEHRHQAFLCRDLYRLARTSAHAMEPGGQRGECGMISGLKFSLSSVELERWQVGPFRTQWCQGCYAARVNHIQL